MPNKSASPRPWSSLSEGEGCSKARAAVIFSPLRHQRLAVQSFEQIKTQIEALPQSEYAKLLDWLSERDGAEWDQAIARDAASGALDFLIDEALEEKKQGKLREL